MFGLQTAPVGSAVYLQTSELDIRPHPYMLPWLLGDLVWNTSCHGINRSGRLPLLSTISRRFNYRQSHIYSLTVLWLTCFAFRPQTNHLDPDWDLRSFSGVWFDWQQLKWTGYYRLLYRFLSFGSVTVLIHLRPESTLIQQICGTTSLVHFEKILNESQSGPS